MTLPQLLTVEDVAAWLRLSPRAVQRLAQSGELPAVRIDGRRYRFPAADLARWLEGRASKDAVPPALRARPPAPPPRTNRGGLAPVDWSVRLPKGSAP